MQEKIIIHILILQKIIVTVNLQIQTPRSSIGTRPLALRGAIHFRPGVSENSRSRPFPNKKAFDSHSRIMGMDFFHSLRVPELWECYFFIPFYILLKVAQYECTRCTSSRLGSDDAVTNIDSLMSYLIEI